LKAPPKASAEHRKSLTMLLDLLVEQVVGRVQLLEDLVKDGELLLGLGLLLLEEPSVMSRVVAAERDALVVELEAEDELVAVGDKRRGRSGENQRR